MADCRGSGVHVAELLKPAWTPGHALPECFNLDGRPVWEPPNLNYSALIDTENSDYYTRRREAALQFTGGDVVKATDIMDTWTESQLQAEYHFWAEEAMRDSSIEHHREGADFFSNLVRQLGADVMDVWDSDSVSKENGWYEFVEEEDKSWTLRTERGKAAREIGMEIDQIWRPWGYGAWEPLWEDENWENSEDSEEAKHFTEAESTGSTSVNHLTSGTTRSNGSPVVLFATSRRISS